MIIIYYRIRDIPTFERPRERLKSVGVNNLTDKELLAIIIKSGIKNSNANDIALEILKQYKVQELPEMTANQLKQIKGIGEVKALELISVIELGKRMYLKEKEQLIKLSNPKDIWKDTRYLFTNKKQEEFYCLYFNSQQELIERKLLFMGTINKSIAHPREVFKEAYRLSASSIICIHNHPSGNLTPSKEDVLFTDSLVKIGKLQGIPILDHIIVNDESYYSFYEQRNILNI